MNKKRGIFLVLGILILFCFIISVEYAKAVDPNPWNWPIAFCKANQETVPAGAGGKLSFSDTGKSQPVWVPARIQWIGVCDKGPVNADPFVVPPCQSKKALRLEKTWDEQLIIYDAPGHGGHTSNPPHPKTTNGSNIGLCPVKTTPPLTVSINGCTYDAKGKGAISLPPDTDHTFTKKGADAGLDVRPAPDHEDWTYTVTWSAGCQEDKVSGGDLADRKTDCGRNVGRGTKGITYAQLTGGACPCTIHTPPSPSPSPSPKPKKIPITVTVKDHDYAVSPAASTCIITVTP